MQERVRAITAEELLRMPEDGVKYELVAERLKQMSPPGFEHGAVTSRLGAALAIHVNEHGLGEVAVGDPGFTLARDPDTVRGPDIAFVTRERIAAVGCPKGYWPGAPDLAVEVVSPDDRRSEMDEKIRDYLRAGAQEIWVVDPARRAVTVHRHDALPHVFHENDVLESSLFPGFRYSLAHLWTHP